MKLSKVLLGSAVLAVLAFGLTSCGKENEDEHGILKVSGKTATADYTNDTDSIQRGFVTTATKHRAVAAVFTIDTNASTDNAGNMGLLFDVVKTDAKTQPNTAITVDTYNFGNITVNYAGKVLRTYVSYYEGVATKDAEGNSLLDGDGNFKDAAGKVISATATTLGAKETQYIPTTGIWESLSSIKADDEGKIRVAVAIIPNAPEADDANGSYTVSFYNVTDINENGKSNDINTWAREGATVLKSTEVPASWTAKAADEETSLPQSLIGYYSAVRGNSTLVAEINLPYLQADADVIEWDEVQY